MALGVRATLRSTTPPSSPTFALFVYLRFSTSIFRLLYLIALFRFVSHSSSHALPHALLRYPLSLHTFSNAYLRSPPSSTLLTAFVRAYFFTTLSSFAPYLLFFAFALLSRRFLAFHVALCVVSITFSSVSQPLLTFQSRDLRSFSITKRLLLSFLIRKFLRLSYVILRTFFSDFNVNLRSVLRFTTHKNSVNQNI